MSFPCLNKAWEAKTKSPTDKLVLVALADMADKADGKCFPSVAYVAERCGLSKRSVFRSIFSLAEDGFLKVKTGGGRHKVSTYILPKKDDTLSPFPALKGDTESIKGDTQSRKGDIPSPQSSGTVNEPRGNGSPPEFKSRLLKQLEEARSEKNRIFAAFALENSILGTSWRTPEAEAKYKQWKQVEKACLDKLPYAI